MASSPDVATRIGVLLSSRRARWREKDLLRLAMAVDITPAKHLAAVC